jgi:hypothetical protein
MPGLVEESDSEEDSEEDSQAEAEEGGQEDSEEEEKEEDSEEEDEEELPSPVIKYGMYCRVFNGLALKFGRKPVDACGTCMRMELQLRQARAGSSAHSARLAEQRAHLHEADAGFRMRAHDRELARQSARARPTVPQEHRAEDGVEFIETDMQAVLGAPSLHVGASFYLRHLGVFNYGVFSGQTDTGFMHFWDELTARKGPDNCLSAVLHHLRTRGTGASALCWWADNYAGMLQLLPCCIYRAWRAFAWACIDLCVCVCVFVVRVCLLCVCVWCMCVWCVCARAQAK